MREACYIVVLALVSVALVGCGSVAPNYDDGPDVTFTPTFDQGPGGSGGGVAFPSYPYQPDVSQPEGEGQSEDVLESDGTILADAAIDAENIVIALDTLPGQDDVSEGEGDVVEQDTQLPGLSCLQITECYSLCGQSKEGVEKTDCEELCAANGKNDDVKSAAQALLECANTYECDLSDSVCVDGFCPDESKSCDNDGIVEEVDPSQPPEKCGGTDGVVCLEKVISPLQVEFQHVSSGVAPPLSGGELSDGKYGLTLVQLYSASLLFGGSGSLPLEFDFKINDSDGAIHIEQDTWYYFSDINVELAANITAESAAYVSLVEGGGCMSVFEGAIVSDIMQCYDGSNPSDDFSTNFAYEVDGAKIRILLNIPNKYILQGLNGLSSTVVLLAETLFVNDLQVMLTLTKM